MPVAAATVAVQASIYDVPGGYRAVMFDRFSGVKDKVCIICLTVELWAEVFYQASAEGTHFLVPWLQRAILYDVRIKPRVSSHSRCYCCDLFMAAM